MAGTKRSHCQWHCKVGQIFLSIGTRWWDNQLEAVNCGLSRTFTLPFSSSLLSLHLSPPVHPAYLSLPPCPRCQWAVWRHITAPLVPAELWRGIGGDGINETCSQELNFAVVRGDVLLRCKLFSPKISQQPSRQDQWQGATCHLWPATFPSSSALHIPATLLVTTKCCKNTTYWPEKSTLAHTTSCLSLSKP